MVTNLGNSSTYVAATAGRPLPTPDPLRRSTVPRCTDCDRAITAHDARLDNLCKRCRTPDQATTPAAERASGYAGTVLTNEQLAKRFTAPSDMRANDIPPDVATPETSTPAQGTPEPDAIQPASTPTTRPSAGAETPSNQVGKRATPVRAKVTKASPDDVVITLHSRGIAARTVEVAALLHDLLHALNQQGAPESPVAARPHQAPSAAATGTTPAPAARKGKPTAGAAPRPGRRPVLEEHAADVIHRYRMGESGPLIADRYGVTKGTVIALLRRHNEPIRPPHRYTHSTGDTPA